MIVENRNQRSNLSAAVVSECKFIMTLESLKGVAGPDIEPLMCQSTNSRLTVPCLYLDTD